MSSTKFTFKQQHIIICFHIPQLCHKFRRFRIHDTWICQRTFFWLNKKKGILALYNQKKISNPPCTFHDQAILVISTTTRYCGWCFKMFSWDTCPSINLTEYLKNSQFELILKFLGTKKHNGGLIHKSSDVQLSSHAQALIKWHGI